MSNSGPRPQNSNGEVSGEPLSSEEREELERLATEGGSIGKIARAWLEVEAEQ